MLPDQTPDNEPPRPEIISYQKLRAFIGITGLLLPIAVVVGCALFGAGSYSWQVSISHYYYSTMHITFVCILCVLGGFLITYQGKSTSESRLSNFAGICAFGIASFPTTFRDFLLNEDGSNQYLELCKQVSHFWGSLHFVFAGLLFTCFAIFCLNYFQKPDGKYDGQEERKFQRRKLIYRFCGWVIIISIVMIGLFFFVLPEQHGLLAYATFIFETTAMWAFGTAWLVKGSAALTQVPVVKNLVTALR